MTLPVTAEFVDPAERDAAIASLRQLLGARLSSAAPVASNMVRMRPIIPT
jgi:hypothetical protein